MTRRAVQKLLVLLACVAVSGCAVLGGAGRADREYTQALFMAIDAVSLIDEAERIALEYEVDPPQFFQDLRARAADLILQAEAVREDAVDEAMNKNIFLMLISRSTPSMKQLKGAHEDAKQLLIEAQEELIRVQAEAGVLILTPEVLIPVEIG